MSRERQGSVYQLEQEVDTQQYETEPRVGQVLDHREMNGPFPKTIIVDIPHYQPPEALHPLLARQGEIVLVSDLERVGVVSSEENAEAARNQIKRSDSVQFEEKKRVKPNIIGVEEVRGRNGFEMLKITIKNSDMPESDEGENRVISLTHQEIQKARLAALGLTNKGIAQALKLSPIRVKMSFSAVNQRNGIKSRTELVALLIDAGIISLSQLVSPEQLKNMIPLSHEEERTLVYFNNHYNATNHEIADYFNIADDTVRNRMSAIMRKLGASDRTHAYVLYRYLQERGLRIEDLQEEKPLVTEDEIELLTLAAQGYEWEEIAYLKGLAESTVKNRMSRVYKKIGVTNKTAAIARLMDGGILSASALVKKDDLQGLEDLNRTEEKLMNYLLDHPGVTAHEVAQELNFADPTIKNRLSEIYSKLHVPNMTRAYVVYRAIKEMQENQPEEIDFKDLSWAAN